MTFFNQAIKRVFVFSEGKTIKVIRKTDEMHREVGALVRDGKTIALVPTMGYLHEGHLALLRQGRKRGDVLVISIFVNPSQFGPNEDFLSYPRDLDRDLRLAESAGVDLVFAPQAADMYDSAHETHVRLDRLPRHLCGLSRPGHFGGVATVVTKLFNIVRPQVALFGEKDYQQLLVIKRLVRDLSYDIRIEGVPTVREADGLAMSSRNTYLSEEERRSALCLSKSLQLAQERVSQGVRDATRIIDDLSRLIGAYPHTRIDYVALCDAETLEDVDAVGGPTLLALAVRIGSNRLIDNAILTPP